MSRRTGVWLGLFILLAIAARVGLITYTNALGAPAEENRLIARHLQGGRGFTFTEFGITGPTAIRGPAYPFLLALIGPDRIWLVLTINVIAGVGTVFAAYTLTKRLLAPSPLEGEGWGEGSAATVRRESRTTPVNPNPNPLPQGEGAQRAALIAAGCFALWPTQLYAASLTQGLSIAVLLTLVSLALAWRRTTGASMIAGVLAGVAVLTEPVLALPLLLSAIVLGWRKNWSNAALFVTLGCLTVAPWLYRNAIVFGRPMPITSNFWRDAFLGNGPQAVGSNLTGTQEAASKAAEAMSTRITRLPPDQYDQLKTTEAKRVQVFEKWVWPWIQSNPVRYVQLSFARMFETWGQSKAWRFGRSPVEHDLFRLSRGFAAALPLVIWLTAVWRYKVMSRLFALSLCLMIGLMLATALSLAVPRNAVLMDCPQFLAATALLERLGHRRKPMCL